MSGRLNLARSTAQESGIDNMVWDPTFDWATASSFNGEARRFSIITEMITQVNLKCVEASITSVPTASEGQTLGVVIELDDKVLELIPLYYDQIAADGSKWTLAKIETQIGSAHPTRSLGYPFTPTWINWIYRAVELLTTLPIMSEYWTGVGSNSAVFGGVNFNARWTHNTPLSTTIDIDTVNEWYHCQSGVGYELTNDVIYASKQLLGRDEISINVFKTSSRVTVTTLGKPLIFQGDNTVKLTVGGGTWTNIAAGWTLGSYLQAPLALYIDGVWTFDRYMNAGIFRIDVRFDGSLIGTWTPTPPPTITGLQVFSVWSSGVFFFGTPTTEFYLKSCVFYDDGGAVV